MKHLIEMFLLVLLISLLSISSVFGCTLGGVTGSMVADNDIFLGQSMDNAWWPTRMTIFVVQPENGYKYIGTKADIWGWNNGLKVIAF